MVLRELGQILATRSEALRLANAETSDLCQQIATLKSRLADCDKDNDHLHQRKDDYKARALKAEAVIRNIAAKDAGVVRVAIEQELESLATEGQ